METDRKNPIPVLATESEIKENFLFVLEDSTIIGSSEIRTADDESYLAPECESYAVPFSYCLGKRYGKIPSTQKPSCVDNNISLNALSGCFDIDGTYREKCTQVGYTQNAYIGLCGSEYADNDHCGTFLEIHVGTGSPYDDESTIISEVKIDQFNVSGYYTTYLNTTYMGIHNRTLCSYTEDFVRIGSTVYINPNAPTCCCPPVYESSTFKGSFTCPIGAGGKGPFAAFLNKTSDKIQEDVDVQSYPFCRTSVDGDDK